MPRFSHTEPVCRTSTGVPLPASQPAEQGNVSALTLRQPLPYQRCHEQTPCSWLQDEAVEYPKAKSPAQLLGHMLRGEPLDASLSVGGLPAGMSSAPQVCLLLLL